MYCVNCIVGSGIFFDNLFDYYRCFLGFFFGVYGYDRE